jgi:8-oxo-dGTP diphosphatase
MSKSFLFRLWRVLPLPFFVRYILIWVSNQKFLIGVDGIIINDRNECLLFKHTYRKQYPWGLPSGYLKKGEDPDRALEREIYEESGYKVHITELLEVYRSKKMPRIGIIYKGKLLQGVPFTPSDEVQDARFVAVDDLLEISPFQIEIIKKYCGPAGRHS